jgi:hypothetical protein
LTGEFLLAAGRREGERARARARARERERERERDHYWLEINDFQAPVLKKNGIRIKLFRIWKSHVLLSRIT